MNTNVNNASFVGQSASSGFRVPCCVFRVPSRACRESTTDYGPRTTDHAPRFNVLTYQRFNAFTLLELLVVISIIILVAAIAGPVVGNSRPNVTAAATRQLLDDVARARQLAISQHTTVYMIFCPSNFWTDQAMPADANDTLVGNTLLDKQLIGYTFVSLRSVGDQPGGNTVHYLAPWRTLPEGAFITPDKFAMLNSQSFYIATNGNPFAYQIFGFNRSSDVAANMNSPEIPFPTAEAPLFNATHEPYVRVPFIAFDYLGRLMSDTITPESKDILIPIAKGSVGIPRDPVTKVAIQGLPSFTETPLGNSSNAFNIIVINHLTGRAHLEYAEVQ